MASSLKLNFAMVCKILWENLELTQFSSVEVILTGPNILTTLILTELVPSTSLNLEQAAKIVKMLLMMVTSTKSLTSWIITRLDLSTKTSLQKLSRATSTVDQQR